LQDPPKFTQLGIFGLKICHLATLLVAERGMLQPVAAVMAYISIPSYLAQGQQEARRRDITCDCARAHVPRPLCECGHALVCAAQEQAEILLVFILNAFFKKNIYSVQIQYQYVGTYVFM
jgi:hypothetical protein